MKKQLITIAAALLTAGALTTSCNSEDNIIATSQQPSRITLTATLAPKGDIDGQTRAITTGTDEVTGKEILHVAWQQGEHIAIYYEKNDGTYATAIATVGTPNADGSAPITATLTNAKGGTAKLVYPYTLAKNGELNTGAGSAFRTQEGTIEYISQYLDAATATGTIDITGGTATFAGPVTMQNQVCICKFNFNRMNIDEAENYYHITIREKQGTSTTHTYEAPSIARASMGAVYMALLGAEGKDFKFSVQGLHKSSATDENAANKNYYEVNSPDVTLMAGEFYRSIPVALTENIVYSTVTIPHGETYTLGNQDINVTSGPAILCKGNATIILAGTNSVSTSAEGQPAIYIPAGMTLTIRGTGSLTAKATGEGGAGIGGGNSIGNGNTYEGRLNCGNIVIEGCTVTAMGGQFGAGIGGGQFSSFGDITINGATVTATGGSQAAGIGGGSCNPSGGNIVINGATITATGGSHATGIGAGYYGYCADITISGGTVTATGSKVSAGIGGSYKGVCGNITITNEVTCLIATMGEGAEVPIGRGCEGSCGTVTIDGTTTWTAGVATAHFYWDVSTVMGKYDSEVTRWTLTHK